MNKSTAPTTDEARPHIEKLRRVKQQRLDALELQAGEFGFETPPHIINEIEQLRAGLAAMEAVTHPPVSEDVMAVLTRYDQARSTMAAVMNLSSVVATIEKAISEDRQERGERQATLDQRFFSLDRRMWVLAGVLAVLVAVVLLLVALSLINGAH